MGKVRFFQTLALHPKGRSNLACRRGLEAGLDARGWLHYESLRLAATGLRGRPHASFRFRPPGGPQVHA